MDIHLLLASTSQLLPELSLTASALVLTVVSPLISKKTGNYSFALQPAIALCALTAAFGLNFERFGNPGEAFSGAIAVDSFSAYFNSIFIMAAAVSILFARNFINRERFGEFLALLLFCVTGMMLMVESRELVSLFISFETMSICVYALAAFSSNPSSSAEAGIKYLIPGGFSSAVILFGIALLYGASGSLYLDVIGAQFRTGEINPMLVSGAGLMVAGLIFKTGLAPLYQWIPDVYQGAPVPVTAFMSVGIKVAAFAVLIRLAAEFVMSGSEAAAAFAAVIAGATMVVGNVAAIAQKNLKRILAYSSIAHAGYATVGIAAFAAGSESGLAGIFYYLSTYAIMNLGAFGIVSVLSKDGNEFSTLSDISGLWRKNPALSVALCVFMFSLIGFPPTIGFFAKYRVFLSAAEAGMYWLVVFGLVNSVISAYYYLRILVFAFMNPQRKQQMFSGRIRLEVTAAVAILCFCSLFLGLFPGYTVEIANGAAETLTAK